IRSRRPGLRGRVRIRHRRRVPRPRPGGARDRVVEVHGAGYADVYVQKVEHRGDSGLDRVAPPPSSREPPLTPASSREPPLTLTLSPPPTPNRRRGEGIREV